MAYKDREKRLAYAKAYYKQNKTRMLSQLKTHYQRAIAFRKALLISEKDVPCSDCGQNFPTCAMDFDHVYGKKSFSIGYAVRTQIPIRALLDEIDKCEVVCANCHRIRTHIVGRVTCVGQ